MASMSDAQTKRLMGRLSSIKHVLLVLSGKGGVGKSSVAVQLALTLLSSQPGARIGLLDIDLTGPSVPRMMGMEGQDVHQSREGWVPVHLYAPKKEDASADEERGVLKCMSIGFLLSNSQESVVWRGPKKTAMIRQFLGDVRWGELDWLIIDTPPGTSDEHISLLEQLRPLLMPAVESIALPTLDSLLVTTPQAVSLSDVSKELSFARRTSLPVLGLIENMSGYVCPHCGDITPVFGKGGGEDFCRIEEEKRMAGQGEGCRFLGRLPIDTEFVVLMDTAARKQQVVDGLLPAETLLDRYVKTPTYKIFKEICTKIVSLVEAE
ncbi:uncharacterized protein L969DRAFT_83775 [Mixia osmundae IAM 14324]|uniref:uncharacterized protein n=1 Tax=Mixia osmundae (strain CBS 9802 / IAM 14324 / JCM 22182 / KY 12970) TaxID=764103 RepID=UPI0004A553A5|nr:uncharacterized protein L969DRAFT_83775 [Mixia osmundae IAM 14324]KEI41919.1 hypothetical protein L969DRAFT_83775 [Mixia osmundae IAM 14324]